MLLLQSAAVRALLTVISPALATFLLAGCGTNITLPPAPLVAEVPSPEEYKIGQGDTIQVAVWRAPELSATVPVRPDGKISTPLIGATQAAGLTSTELADAIKAKLKPYALDPVVSVIVDKYSDPLAVQVRAIGEVNKPTAVPYRDNMTMLDVLIGAGGLTRFAGGNDAVLVRHTNGSKQAYRVRLNDLVKNGDISADVAVLPGDIIIVPRDTF